MAVIDDQVQTNYSDDPSKAALLPFSSIACFAVIVSLSGAACVWLKYRKGRSQVNPTQQMDTLVMASKHGIARCVSLNKPPEPLLYSPGDIWSVSNASFTAGVVPELPAIFVTPPSPPTSDTSIGSCGDLLLVDDDIEDIENHNINETFSSSLYNRVDNSQHCEDIDNNSETDKGDCDKYYNSGQQISADSIKTSESKTAKCDTEVNSSLQIVISNSSIHRSGQINCSETMDHVSFTVKSKTTDAQSLPLPTNNSYSHVPVVNSVESAMDITKDSVNAESISNDLGAPSVFIIPSRQRQDQKTIPTVTICDEPEPDQRRKPVSSPKPVSPGHDHRPDFTDVFPVDEIPMAEPTAACASSFNSGKCLNFTHSSHSASSHHLLSPNSAYHSRSGFHHSNQVHHYHPPSTHLQHLQHHLIVNGHHHTPHQHHYHHHISSYHQHQHSSQHVLGNSHFHPSFTPKVTNDPTTASAHHLDSVVNTSSSPHHNETTKHAFAKQRQLNSNETQSIYTQPKLTGQASVLQRSKSSEFLDDDDDFNLEQSSPRPRLSSMEPGTRKTDFKFRRPKKLTSS